MPNYDLRVTREWLHLDDERIGVVYGDASDQGAKVQAALDYAGALHSDHPGTVFVGGPVPNMGTTELTTQSLGRPVRILGADMGASDVGSYLKWPTDLGPGKYCGKLGNNWRVENLLTLGPGSSSPTDGGDLPSEMGGWLCPTRGIMRDVNVTGFRSGVAVLNDHQEWHSCDFGGNGYAMEWIDNATGGLGDQVIHRCFTTSCTRASFGISSSNTIANARFTGNGHSGGSPFCIHRYFGNDGAAVSASGSSGNHVLTGVSATSDVPPVLNQRVVGTNIPENARITNVSGTSGNYSITLNLAPIGDVFSAKLMADRPTVMVGVMFENWSWEGWRHAMFYDQPGDGFWSNITFSSQGEANGFGHENPSWPGMPTDLAAIDVGYIDGMYWRNGAGVPAPTQHYDIEIGAEDVGVQFNAIQIGDVRSDSGFEMFGHLNQIPGLRPFKIKAAAGGNIATAGIQVGEPALNSGGGLYNMSAARCAGSIAKGDLVELNDHSYVQTSQNGANSKIVGFSMDDYVDGEVCVYAFSGRGVSVNNKSGLTIATGVVVVPDPVHAGAVKAASSLNDRQVGWNYNASIPSGTSGTVLANISI